jgi:hypothetical protein
MEEADQLRRDLPPLHGYLLNVLGMTALALAASALPYLLCSARARPAAAVGMRAPAKLSR